MWKYGCKKHLLYVLLAMVAGAVLFGVFGFGKDAILMALETMEESMSIPIDQYISFVENPIYLAMFGAFYIGGFVNGLMLVFALNTRFHLNSIVLLLIFLLGGDLILLIGGFLLLPTILVCLYGMLTMPNRKERNQLKQSKISNVDELKRLYELQYQIDEKGTLVGNEAASNLIKIAVLNILAIGIYLLVLVYVADTVVVLIAGAILMMLLFMINRMQGKAMAPVASLLYDQCNPQACASAIFAMCKKLHRKRVLPLSVQFAEAMLYLNDPHLCIDALALHGVQRGSGFITYHTLMADAYYMLGDKMMVETHYEEVEKASEHGQINPLIASQVLETIQCRIHMMNENFEIVKQFYSKYQALMRRKSQLVELNYYIGLLSFVDKEFEEAQRCLEFVVRHGGSTYYVEKSEKLLETLQKLG